MAEKLNPGSPEAIEAGCQCAVLDNNHGRGAYTDETGTLIFWKNMNCPLHGQENNGDNK